MSAQVRRACERESGGGCTFGLHEPQRDPLALIASLHQAVPHDEDWCRACASTWPCASYLLATGDES